MSPLTVHKSADPRRIPVEGTILVAHQPEFLPYLGNISKAAMGDVYFILDTVQFVKKHWQSRNRIRVSGDTGFQWLTVPCKNIQNHYINTNEVLLDGDFWKRKHLKAIKLAYQKAPFFEEIFPAVSEIYMRKHTMLVDFLMDLIHFAFSSFNIEVPVYRTSALIEAGYDISGHKSGLVINMSKAAGADTYVFGVDGRTYIDKELFVKENIRFLFQDFNHPEYPQVHGEFMSHMCFLDLLFNHGNKSVDILGQSNYLET